MIIVHDCRNCRHRVNWHQDNLCSHGACRCKRLDEDPEPRIAPTYRNDRVKLADCIEPRVIPPGEAMNPQCPKFSHRVTACDCHQCRALYAETHDMSDHQ